MEEFAFEVFVPRRDGGVVAAEAGRLAALAGRLRAEGNEVRYLRALHLPQDETCFFVFEADSLTSMRRLRARARLERSRLVPAAFTDEHSTQGGPR